MAKCCFMGQSPNFDSDLEDDGKIDKGDKHSIMLSSSVATSGGLTSSSRSLSRSDDARFESLSGSGGEGSVFLPKSFTRLSHLTNQRYVVNTPLPPS